MFSVEIEKLLGKMSKEDIKNAIIKIAEEIESLESQIKNLGDEGTY